MSDKKHEILVGLETLKSVRTTPFLPGLVLHKAVDCPPGQALLTVSYVRAGTAVARDVTPGKMKEVKELLSTLNWDITPAEMLESAQHRAVSDKAMALSNKERSLRQEKRIAQDTGAKRQPASGALWGHSRDHLLPRFKFEAKETQLNTFKLDVKDLAFLKKEAYAGNRIGVYIIEMAGHEELCIIPKGDADDDLLLEATIVPLKGSGKSIFTLTVEHALAAVHGTVYELELSTGMYYAFSYERFLRLVKRGGVDT